MMTKKAVKIICLFAILLLPLKSSGAENVKFRFLLSVNADEKGNGLKLSEGVACNGKSLLIIADAGNSRLLKFTFQNDTLSGGTEIKASQLTYPVRVQTNSKGEIFALDEKQRRIVRLSPEGTFLGYLEPAVVSEPAMIVPRSFKIDISDFIYVLDIFGARVLVLDPSGKLIKQLNLPENYGFISDIAVDAGGALYLLDSLRAVVYKAVKNVETFSPLTKELKENMSFPVALVVDNQGMLYIADRDAGDIAIIGQDGTFLGHQLRLGWKEGQLYYPSQLCVNDKGEMFIADRNNSRVQIFSLVK